MRVVAVHTRVNSSERQRSSQQRRASGVRQQPLQAAATATAIAHAAYAFSCPRSHAAAAHATRARHSLRSCSNSRVRITRRSCTLTRYICTFCALALRLQSLDAPAPYRTLPRNPLTPHIHWAATLFTCLFNSSPAHTLRATTRSLSHTRTQRGRQKE